MFAKVFEGLAFLFSILIKICVYGTLLLFTVAWGLFVLIIMLFMWIFGLPIEIKIGDRIATYRWFFRVR